MLVAGLTTIALLLSATTGAVSQDGGWMARSETEPEAAGFIAPSWLQMPQPEYPREALRTSTQGEALVECVVQTDGSAGVCEIISETPAGVGFGEAVLAAMPAARWTPAMLDGAPVERSVRFNTPFTFAPTTKAPPEMRSVAQAILAEGYASGTCRHLLNTQTAARWDAMQREIESRPEGFYRPYDQIFVAGYEMGRRDATERGRPTSSDCVGIHDWAREIGKTAQAAYQKLDAKSTLDERAQWRPVPE